MSIQDVIYSGSNPSAWGEVLSVDVQAERARRRRRSRGRPVPHDKLTKVCIRVVAAVATGTAIFVSSQVIGWARNDTAAAVEDATPAEIPTAEAEDDPFNFKREMDAAWEGAMQMFGDAGEDPDSVVAEAGDGLQAWSRVPASAAPPEEGVL